MIQLHVEQFISHLYLEQQGALLTSKEAMLVFLREQFQRDEDAKRLLWNAGRAQARGERVRVDCTPEEREAAQAIVYAVGRLAERARKLRAERDLAREVSGLPVSRLRVYRDPSKAEGGKRQPWHWATMGGLRFRASQDDLYPREAWQAAQELSSHPFESLRDRITATNRARGHDFLVDSEEEMLETSTTAHFEGSSRGTGYARVTVDGVEVGRTRCWSNLDPVPETEQQGNLERFLFEKLLARVRSRGVRVVRGEFRRATCAKFDPVKHLLLLEERLSPSRALDTLENFARDVLTA
jgi:hypothetical protein